MPEDRTRLAALLREISTHEHRAGRPLLSALVVLQGRQRPGRGFFNLARELGVMGDTNHADFVAHELDRVYACWAPGTGER